MSSPHICHVISGLNEGGGIERHVRDLTGDLSKSLRISVLADPSMAPLFQPDVEFWAVNYRRSRINPLLMLELWKVIRAISPDCIHVHGRKAARLIGLLNRFLRLPTVITIHNLSPSSSVCKRFDAVIGVSAQITEGISHPCKFTIYNGRG